MTLSSLAGLKRNLFRYSEVWTEADETVAQYLKQNTDKNSVFLAPTDDFNPVSTLAGRRVLTSSDMTLFKSGFIWFLYQDEAKTLRSNPDSKVLPFVQYALENDHHHQQEHLNAPDFSDTCKVIYGFEAYQLYNRTLVGK